MHIDSRQGLPAVCTRPGSQRSVQHMGVVRPVWRSACCGVQVALPGRAAPLSSSLPGPLGTIAKLFERSASDPFYAVLAYKDFKPERN